MSTAQETPRPPETAEFGHVVAGGSWHDYPLDGCAAVRKLSVGSFDNNVYVVRCSTTNEALIVDAAAEAGRIIDAVEGATVVAIAQTHEHPDHVQALREIAGTFGCPVYAHPDDHYEVETTPALDGMTIAVGGLTVEVLHTPGHTPGSISLRCNGTLFSGDALFPGGPGNTWGDPGRFATAIASVDRLMDVLPDATRIAPGHGLDSTIGRERPFVETWRARGW